MKDKDAIKKAVREGYAGIAKQEHSSCCETAGSCCESGNTAQTISRRIGYTEEQLGAVTEDTNLGLGCGNPVALSSLEPGQVVLDLGSGAGIDCFLAARKVGSEGRVIGIDMTPEMIERARENARKGGYENVEFRLGEIENLPVADQSCDRILSNCVINLSPDKERVFREVFRVLRPGGRFMISDVVLLKELPDCIRNSIKAYIGCLSGAVMKDQYIRIIREAGFQDVRIVQETPFPIECMANDPTAKAVLENPEITPEQYGSIAGTAVSIQVSGVKPESR